MVQYPCIRPPNCLHYVSKESNGHYILDPIVVTPLPDRISPAQRPDARTGGKQPPHPERRLRPEDFHRCPVADAHLHGESDHPPAKQTDLGPASPRQRECSLRSVRPAATASRHPRDEHRRRESGLRACTKNPLRLIRRRKVVARERDHCVPGNQEASCVSAASHELQARGGDRWPSACAERQSRFRVANLRQQPTMTLYEKDVNPVPTRTEVDGRNRLGEARATVPFHHQDPRPWPHRPLRSEMNDMPEADTDIRLMADAARRSLPLSESRLPDAFFPAHLTVALVDAALRPRNWRPVPLEAAARYCRRFGLAPRRPERWELPPADEQETLKDLLRHFDELGTDAMARELLGTSSGSPAAARRRMEYLPRAARSLRSIGVEILQDVRCRPPEAVEATLRGDGPNAARLLLMYTGEDDFVRGDTHVRRFVASAIGRRSVPADRAEALVRAAAHELILAPRFLDCLIWQHGVSGAGVARPPAPTPGNREG